MTARFGTPAVSPLTEDTCDALVVLTFGSATQQRSALSSGSLSRFATQIQAQQAADEQFASEGGLLLLPDAPFQRLVVSPIGPANRDYDDVRNFGDAATRGLGRALKAGARKPLVVLPSGEAIPKQYTNWELATLLESYQFLYTPLENREDTRKTFKGKVDSVGFTGFSSEKRSVNVVRLAQAIESGRAVARDIGGSDPERMSAPKVATYVEGLFKGSDAIKVEVISDRKVIEKEFPCLGAVNRANLDRHSARVVFLSYEPPNPTKTLFLVGKGVTYDTGGSDVKAGGIMAGMHRDKCGAAAVAGFLETVNQLRPQNVRVYGALALVRNSLGPDGYVADELIVSRAGVKLRVGNTDAEGRLAMVDLLAYYKEKILREKIENAEMFTIATLTGHCCMAVGFDYTIIMDNGPARGRQTAQKLQQAGDRVGDLFEISTIRREDYKFNEGKSEYEEILHCNNAPSSRTPRGHQIPGAFLIQVSKLDQHGLDSAVPIPFSHIDIAGSSGPFPGIPTGAPIGALSARYLLEENQPKNRLGQTI